MSRILFKPLFVGPGYQTGVWATDEVLEAINEYLEQDRERHNAYIEKVRYYAQAGFSRHEGEKRGIRYKKEWRVYAIEPWKTLFRLFGRYENDRKTDFLIASTTLKPGQKMSPKDKKAAQYAADILDSDQWEKEKELE